MFNNFPQKLIDLPQWVVWKYEENDKGKPTKILYNPEEGYKASSTNPKTWSTFKNSLATYETQDYNGIGFVFNKDIVGIDLDKCINDDGTIKQWAKDILGLFDSYTEYSPSKKGLHIIIESNLDFKGHKKEWLNELKEKEGIECYMTSRYFTVTGNVFEGRSELKHIDETKLFEWYKNTFEKEEKLVVEIVPNTATLPNDDEIIGLMKKARNGQRFTMLFERGDFVNSGFPSQSEADMSLVNSLMFFCRNDIPTVDRIFRKSKLYRKKWDRQDYRNELFKKCYRLQIMDWSRPGECDEPEDELVIRSMAGVAPANVRWLWKSRLAKGKLTLFQGDPGQGKSQVTIYIASIISKGGTFVDDDECEEGEVLFITAEDDAADTLKPRLMAQDAKMENIYELQWIKTAQGKTKLFNFDKYMEDLKKVTKTLKRLKLIVVDPISAFLGKIDGNASSEVRGLLYELKGIAEEVDCSVILVTHNNKNGVGQKAVSRASGSHAFGAAARMVYAFGIKPLEEDEEPPKEQQFAMAPIKNNLTKDPDTLVYLIKSDYVFQEGDEDNPIATSKIVWNGTTDFSAQQIVDYNPSKKRRKGSSGRPDDKYQECKKQIEYLTFGKKELSSNEVRELMGQLTEYVPAMIKKARLEIGYITSVSKGTEVSWILKID